MTEQVVAPLQPISRPVRTPVPWPAIGWLLAAAVLGVALAFVGFEVRAPFVFSGALVGMLVGITGVGGGSLMTPLLILLFGVHPASAVGTDLLYASATKTVGTGVHASNRTVDWRLVGRLAAGSIPATLATLALMRGLGLDGASYAKALSVGVGGVLLVTAAALLLRDRLARTAQERAPALSDLAAARLTTVLGAVLGVMITLTSVGAGALGVTALVFLHPRLPLKRIVGSDIAHAVPLTLIAGLGHWSMGSVDFALLGSLLLGSIPGIVVGSLLAPRLPETALRLTLAAVLTLVGVKLLF